MRYVDGVDVVLALVLSGFSIAFVGGSLGSVSLRFKEIARTGLILHLVGAVVRYLVNAFLYGTGDSFRYFRAGKAFADEIWLGDFGALSVAGIWGTGFVDRFSGLLQLVIGQNFLAESVLFTLLGYWGLVLMARALAGALPGGARWQRGVMLVLYWPSLCFWPSTIGKEALILLALGLVVTGWHGNGRSLTVPPLLGGLGLALLIRPHIAMLLSVAIAAAEWLGPVARWSAKRLIRAGILVVLAGVAVSASLDRLGVETDIDAVADFAEDRAGRTRTGGSQIEVTGGPTAVPMAFVNVLMRPFLWEARNPVMLLSAIELLAMWAMAWPRREVWFEMVARWRESRLLLFAVPAAAMLILFYGAFVSNLGILARQRVVVFPLLFMFLEITSAIAVLGRSSVSRRSMRV